MEFKYPRQIWSFDITCIYPSVVNFLTQNVTLPDTTSYGSEKEATTVKYNGYRNKHVITISNAPLTISNLFFQIFFNIFISFPDFESVDMPYQIPTSVVFFATVFTIPSMIKLITVLKNPIAAE